MLGKGSSQRVALVSAAAALLVPLALGVGSAGSAGAATGGNFIATGHDLDYHCASGTTLSCDYFRIVVQKAQNGSTLPILALDEGTDVAQSVTNGGITTAVVTVSPVSSTFAGTAFTSSSGAPLYSAIVVASDETCGGCDNSRASAQALNTRSADFAAFFNAGGGIVALAGAENRDIYYNFVPLSGVSAAAVAPPFTVTAAGAAIGLTDAQANCCMTHNAFNQPGSPFVVLETDSAGLAETIAVFNGTIGGGGFSPAPTATATGTSTLSPSATPTATISPSATPTATMAPSPRPTKTPKATPSCKPGYGYGDKNHCHTGPPGRSPSARPKR